MVDPSEVVSTSKKSEVVNLLVKDQRMEQVIPSDAEVLNYKLNKLAVKSSILRECISEFIATFILVFMGDCVLASLIFAHGGKVGLAAVPLGWGFALLVAVAVTGGSSGCHANPAVTLAFASIKKIKWNRVLPYFLAQYLGAFVAAVLVFAVYYDSIAAYDGGKRQVLPDENATAQIFATYPPPHVSIWAAFLDQIMATGLLLMGIVAILDPRNLSVHKGLYPILIGFVFGGIIYALPYNCMAPLNPARDLSPRLFTLMVGYGIEVFSHRGYVYFMVPILAPHIGGLLGAWIYKIGIEINLPKNIEGRPGFGNQKLTDDSEPLEQEPAVSTAPLIQIDR